MIPFILLSLPIFGVVALGWAATRWRLATPGALDALGTFAFHFALPALVFRLIAGQPLGRSFNAVFYGGYLASGSIIFALVFGFSCVVDGQTSAAAGARATTTTVSNLGFLGPPLVVAFFGERGAGPLAMAILAEVMVLLLLGGVIMAVSSAGGASVRSLLVRATVFNPLIVAILLGVALAASETPTPTLLDQFLAFLGGSGGPTALFALGGTLAMQRIDRKTAIAAAGITAAKLVVYPLLVWYVLQRMLDVEIFWVQTGVLLASLPPAGSNFVLAQRYAADADRVSAAIVLSTAVSVVTVPLAAWMTIGT